MRFKQGCHLLTSYMHLQTLDKERYFTTWNLNETDIF